MGVGAVWPKIFSSDFPNRSVTVAADNDTTVLEPQGRFLGLPYDIRRPSLERFKARFWNPEDERVLTPMAFGWGYAINLHAASSRIMSMLGE